MMTRVEQMAQNDRSRSWRQKRNGSKLINFIQTAADQLAMLPLNQNAEVTK
jgi:hypothetical protein